MSDLPSPLKSPIPLMTQSGETPLRMLVASAIDGPFISHRPTAPVEVLRQMMSALPSPLTSPTPLIIQSLVTPLTMLVARMIEAPFISHRPTSPVVVLRQMRSALASPLTSPVPLMTHCGPGSGITVCDVTVVLLTSQICGVPANGSLPFAPAPGEPPTSWNSRSDVPSVLKSLL